MAEADKIAKKLRKDGWTVERQTGGGGGLWIATHPDTDTVIKFSRNPRAQRIMDEADEALGRSQRSTSGENRKTKAAKERVKQEAQEAARRKALDTLLTNRPNPGLLVEIKSASYHALKRAFERNIGYDDIYDTLLRPIRTETGETPNTQVLVGPECTVVVDLSGTIVTVWKGPRE